MAQDYLNVQNRCLYLDIIYIDCQDNSERAAIEWLKHTTHNWNFFGKVGIYTIDIKEKKLTMGIYTVINSPCQYQK